MRLLLGHVLPVLGSLVSAVSNSLLEFTLVVHINVGKYYWQLHLHGSIE